MPIDNFDENYVDTASNDNEWAELGFNFDRSITTQLNDRYGEPPLADAEAQLQFRKYRGQLLAGESRGLSRDTEDPVAKTFDHLLERCDDETPKKLQALVEAVRQLYWWHTDRANLPNVRRPELEEEYGFLYEDMLQRADAYWQKHFPQNYKSQFVA